MHNPFPYIAPSIRETYQSKYVLPYASYTDFFNPNTINMFVSSHRPDSNEGGAIAVSMFETTSDWVTYHTINELRFIRRTTSLEASMSAVAFGLILVNDLYLYRSALNIFSDSFRTVSRIRACRNIGDVMPLDSNNDTVITIVLTELQKIPIPTNIYYFKSNSVNLNQIRNLFIKNNSRDISAYDISMIAAYMQSLNTRLQIAMSNELLF